MIGYNTDDMSITAHEANDKRSDESTDGTEVSD
jgi:hypothetical protein